MAAKVKDAILSLRPGAQWAVYDNDYSTLIWYGDDDPPELSVVQAEILRLDAEALAGAYRDKRANKYPSIGDQLDALYHAGVFPADMAAQIKAVKDSYPKPDISA
jgi:hypothetical protein